MANWSSSLTRGSTLIATKGGENGRSAKENTHNFNLDYLSVLKSNIDIVKKTKVE